MNVFFNENGLLNLDEAVMKMPTFRKIMEDGIVTDSELSEQAEVVSLLLHKVEDTFSASQAALVKGLLAEMGVLFAVYNYKELQSLR